MQLTCAEQTIGELQRSTIPPTEAEEGFALLKQNY